MPPHSESGLSDIVRDWKIETEVYDEYIKHIFYESGSSARERHIRKEEQWKRQKVLGEGGYGRVYLEKCVQGDKQDKLRAVKEIKSQDFKYSRELDAIIKFSHYRYAHCFVQSFGWFESDDSVFIAMEYYEMGDLQRYLTRPLPEPEARRITFQVLEGLEFMHDNGFVHRDIKPGNTLVVTAGPEWFVKIADFGISKRRQPGVTTVRTKQIGTHGFTAPELLNFKSENAASSYTHSVDMWSLGAMAYLMLTNTIPFENLGDLYEYAYKSSSFPSQSLQKHHVSEQGVNFIIQLMSSKAQDRPTAPAAKSHGWLLRADTCTDEDIQQSYTSGQRLDTVSDTVSDPTFASTASKAWSISTITHDMISETDQTIKQFHPSIQDEIKHGDSRGKHAATISTLTKQTFSQSNTPNYQSPSVEDSQETLNIDSGRCLPAGYKYILESSTDNAQLGESALPSVVPTPSGSNRESTEKATTSPKNRGISTKYYPSNQNNTPNKSSDLKPVNINHSTDVAAKAGEVASPNRIQSRHKRPLVLNTKITKDDSKSSRNTDKAHKAAITSLVVGAGGVATETELSPISPVVEPTTTVYCQSCSSGYTIQMFRGPVEYLPCRHYICHTCLVQLLALSLLSPKYMSMRCCSDSLEEISRSKFTRILLDPRIANVWDVWEDLKILKESGWTCANGHFSPKDSLLVTDTSIPIWKQPVNCSDCAKSGNFQQAEFCLLCGEAISTNGCGCKFNKAIANFIEILFTSGALKAETKLSAELWTAIRIWNDLRDRNPTPFGFRPWKNCQFLEPEQQSANPASRPRSMEPMPGQRNTEPTLRQRSSEPDINTQLAVTPPKPQCYACGADIFNQASLWDYQICTCGAYHCSRCGIKWKQCNCPPTSSETDSRNKKNRRPVIITQHQDRPQDAEVNSFKDKSPTFAYVEIGSTEKSTPRYTYSRSEGSHSQDRITRQDTYMVEPETRRTHAYEDDLEYILSQPRQNSGRSLEPSSAYRRPTGNRTYYSTPRLDVANPRSNPRSTQPHLSSYAEESTKAQKAKRKPRDSRTYF